MNKQELIDVYQDTLNKIKKIPIPYSKKYKLDTNLEIMSGGKKANVLVEPIDTVSAIIKYSKSGKVAVLNMTSSKRKGGGVINGSRAQEESLFRCSNLVHIPDNYYPLNYNDYILTEDSHFIKDFNYNDMTPIKCDVISVAAINLNNNHIDIKEKYNIDYDDLMTTKIYNMLIACKNCNTIILGAWGCGVFNNDPKVVSKLFKQTIEKYNLDSLYDNIIFAVINDHNSVDNNFKIFKDEFTRSI